MKKWTFGVLMAVFMVYGMEVYNAALRQGGLTQGKNLSNGQQILARQLCTVLFMCPAMSLVAVFIFKGGLQPAILAVWGGTVLMNAPMALGWQVLVAGPAVRFLVSLLPEHEMGLKRVA